MSVICLSGHVLFAAGGLVCAIIAAVFAGTLARKPGPEEILTMLKQGNERFVSGKPIHPHTDSPRLHLAATADQADHAYATVLTCSDSRVPVELIFDAGIMDLFVIRVAGNVCKEDEIGSIEYGLCHVNTPLLVVLGHTKCGAVTAAAKAVQGDKYPLERNIPPLIAPIQEAVKAAMVNHPEARGDAIIPYAIEANVWHGIETLFMESAVTRHQVATGTVKVVGAIYDVGTGAVNWLPSNTVDNILSTVEASPKRAINTMATD